MCSFLLFKWRRDYFYVLDFLDTVKDIREQFPLLPLEEKELIAEELGYEHPKDSETGELIVMTMVLCQEKVQVKYDFFILTASTDLIS